MLRLVFITLTVFGTTLVESEINGRFFRIEQEIPNYVKSTPRILSPDTDRLFSIKIETPSETDIKDAYYQPIDFDDFDVVPKTETISNTGWERVNDILNVLQRTRGPVAVVVQDDPEVLRTTEIYMNHIIGAQSLAVDVWLMKYNASGVSDVLARRSTTRIAIFPWFFAVDTAKTKQNIGQPTEAAASFFSLLKATRLLPHSAAIILFTNAPVEDEDLAQLAIKEMTNKQIQLIVVWQGAYPSYAQEYNLLREACKVTQGAFIIGNTERKFMNDISYVQVSGKANPVITHRTSVHGHQQIRVPIENGVHAIHVSLTHGVTTAKLRTPQGYLIDLLNITEVARFAIGSYVIKTSKTYECELRLGGGGGNAGGSSAANVGVWYLETNAPTQIAYDIVVSVRHELTVETDVVNVDVNGQPTGKRRLQLNVVGNYAKIDNISLITTRGEQIDAQHLRVHINDHWKQQDDIETFQPGANVSIDLDPLPRRDFYVQLSGKDSTGNDFQRISYYNPRQVQKIIEPTTIHIAEGSELLQTPGRASKIHYNVKNNRDNVIFLKFHASDERSYLRRLSPLWAWINPHQTVIVTLEMISKGADDFVTFTASGGTDRIQKRAHIRSQTSQMPDNEVPHMWHKFTSNCQEVIFSSCEDHSWTAEVTAQDRETGLLLMQSSPEGLYFPQGYTSGTTEEITGVLSGSCCDSKLILTAIDLASNRRSYEASAYWAPLSAGSISAIVISILLILLIIAIITYCCVWGKCKTKQKASHDIPSPVRYRGPDNSASTTRY